MQKVLSCIQVCLLIVQGVLIVLMVTDTVASVTTGTKISVFSWLVVAASLVCLVWQSLLTRRNIGKAFNVKSTLGNAELRQNSDDTPDKRKV